MTYSVNRGGLGAQQARKELPSHGRILRSRGRILCGTLNAGSEIFIASKTMSLLFLVSSLSRIDDYARQTLLREISNLNRHLYAISQACPVILRKRKDHFTASSPCDFNPII